MRCRRTTTYTPPLCSSHVPSAVRVGPDSSAEQWAVLDRILCPRGVPVTYRVGRDAGSWNAAELGVGDVADAADLFRRLDVPWAFVVEAHRYPGRDTAAAPTVVDVLVTAAADGRPTPGWSGHPCCAARRTTSWPTRECGR